MKIAIAGTGYVGLSSEKLNFTVILDKYDAYKNADLKDAEAKVYVRDIFNSDS